MAEKGMTNELQFLGTSYASGTKLETREIELPVETWEKLDELMGKGIGPPSRSPEKHRQWILNFFIFLCSYDDRFARGILPREPNTESPDK